MARGLSPQFNWLLCLRLRTPRLSSLPITFLPAPSGAGLAAKRSGILIVALLRFVSLLVFRSNHHPDVPGRTVIGRLLEQDQVIALTRSYKNHNNMNRRNCQEPIVALWL